MREVKIQAELHCELGGESIMLHSSRNVLTVAFGSWSTLLRLMRLLSPLAKTGRRNMVSLLKATQWTVELHVRSKLIASLGPSKGGVRLPGMPCVQLYPVAIATSTFPARR